MTENIKPILTGLILGPLTIQASASPTTHLENTLPRTSTVKSSALRKIRFESAYQSNLFSFLHSSIPMGKYVGELQEKWQFPSDHLPIGMTIDGLHTASWNVLNSEYMSWVTDRNSQGLSRSLIAKEHVYLEGSKLTVRDLHVIECIKSMLAQSKSVISLQECSQAFITELQEQLPEEYGIVLSSDVPIKDQNIIIYDKCALALDSSRTEVSKIFSKDQRTVLNACFTRKDNGETFRVINGHLPGEPGNPAPDEFAHYVASFTSSNELVIAMGDMNFNEVEMKTAFQKNGPFECLAPYCTNISPSPELFSKSIDHFFIFDPAHRPMTADSLEELMPGLGETVDLLT